MSYNNLVKKTILLVAAVSVVLGVLFWLYGANFFSKKKETERIVELNLWGINEDEGVVRTIINAYQKAKPNIKITYTKQTLLNYRTKLSAQLPAGQGPDIFPIHSSWLPMFWDNLSAVPLDLMTISEYNSIYYPVIANTLTKKGKIYALPLELDGLGMYYNEDILKASNTDVPKTWAQFVTAAKKMTVPNTLGQIQTSGAALGTTANVDFWPEILTVLFLQQPKASLSAPASQEGAEALDFYLSFVTNPRTKTWDTTLPSSTEMFEEGRLAFYFAPAFQIKEIESKAPNLHFKIAPLPSLEEGKNTYLAFFWAEAVSASSAHQKEAWEFLKFLSSAEALQFIFDQTSLDNGPRLPYPRMELAKEQVSDPKLGAFLAQGPNYSTWYLNSQTQDGGLNEEMIEVFKKAVDRAGGGTDSQEALSSLSPQVKEVLNKYGIN